MPANRSMSLAMRLSGAALCVAILGGCQGNVAPWRAASFGGQSQQKLKNPAKTHLAFAKLSERTGNLQAARESYLTVLEEDPQSVEATIGLAGLELRAGHIREAERGFLKASQLDPKDPLVAEALGQFYLSQDRYGDAEQFLRQGHDSNPADRRLQYRLALSLARQRRVTEAEPLFVQSVGEAEADYNIGLILFEQGETVAAEQRLLRAVMKKPTLNEAQHWLEVVRNERASTMIATSPQQPLQQNTNGSALPYGAVNAAIGSEHINHARLGSLNLATRQTLEQQPQNLINNDNSQTRLSSDKPSTHDTDPSRYAHLFTVHDPSGAPVALKKNTIPNSSKVTEHKVAQTGPQVTEVTDVDTLPKLEEVLGPVRRQQPTYWQHQPWHTARISPGPPAPPARFQTQTATGFTATQIEQFQNSMTPKQRMAFLQQMQMQTTQPPQ